LARDARTREIDDPTHVHSDPDVFWTVTIVSLVGAVPDRDLVADLADPAAREQATMALRRSAERRLSAALPRRCRALLKPVLRNLGSQLRSLELCKSSLLMNIDGVRAAIRAHGERLVADGVLVEVDDASSSLRTNGRADSAGQTGRPPASGASVTAATRESRRARIDLTPDARCLEDGDILVRRITDPG
jgi:hypothetical protein